MANKQRLYYNGGLTGKDQQYAYVVSKGNPMLLPEPGGYLEVSEFTARDIMRNYNIDSQMFTLGAPLARPTTMGAPKEAANISSFSRAELEAALRALEQQAPVAETRTDEVEAPAVSIPSIRKGKGDK